MEGVVPSREESIVKVTEFIAKLQEVADQYVESELPEPNVMFVEPQRYCSTQSNPTRVIDGVDALENYVHNTGEPYGGEAEDPPAVYVIISQDYDKPYAPAYVLEDF